MSSTIFGYYGIGLRALGAAQSGLSITGDNIANVNTPGFSRRRIDLRSGLALQVPGGFLDETNGVWNSEAPRDDEVEIGQRVVVFYKWLDDMGGGVSGNALYAMHGGLFRTAVGPKGRVVLGRGQGYAIRQNATLDDVDSAVSSIRR